MLLKEIFTLLLGLAQAQFNLEDAKKMFDKLFIPS